MKLNFFSTQCLLNKKINKITHINLSNSDQEIEITLSKANQKNL
jgi:hypothetical protein